MRDDVTWMDKGTTRAECEEAQVGVIKFTSRDVHKINIAQSNPLHRSELNETEEEEYKKFEWFRPPTQHASLPLVLQNMPEKMLIQAHLKRQNIFPKECQKVVIVCWFFNVLGGG